MRVTLVLFLGGMLAMGYLVAAIFFLRYWRRTRERLFASFATALFILALQRALLAANFAIIEDDTWYYGLRLLAFVIILWAIVDQNRAALDKIGAMPVGGSPADFGDGVRTDVAHWAKVINDADIKLPQ